MEWLQRGILRIAVESRRKELIDKLKSLTVMKKWNNGLNYLLFDLENESIRNQFSTHSHDL
jgi:hypothetical protein